MTPVLHARAVGALRTLATSTPEHRCDLCARPLAGAHRHAIDRSLALGCVCDPCHLTLSNPDGRWLAVDDTARPRRVAVPDLPAPVGIAFAVVDDEGRPLVRYPGPAGTQVEADVDPAWLPVVADLRPRVEALVIIGGRFVDGPDLVAWRLPVDRLFTLTSTIGAAWVGLDGGRPVVDVVRDWLSALGDDAR